MGGSALLFSSFLFDYDTDADRGNSDDRDNDCCWIHDFSPFILILVKSKAAVVFSAPLAVIQ